MPAPSNVEAFFRESLQGDSRKLVPLPLAHSGWGAGIRGMAVGGALAREVETVWRATGLDGFTPVRWTLELLRPVAMDECEVLASVLRHSRRTAVVDAEMWQGDELVARATALFLRVTDSPEERVWSGGSPMEFPSGMVLPSTGDRRLFHTPGAGWDPVLRSHQSAERKQVWCAPLRIVEGESPSAFQFIASTVDVASVVTNWGSSGLQYINTDVSLHIARLPEGDEIGLAAADRVVYGGIAVGTASLWDRTGPLGLVSTSALANPERAVNVASWAPGTGAVADGGSDARRSN